MRVIILAAGEGKRLGPLTKDKPKCLISLFGKSLLQHQLDIFESCNIKDISIVTGYKNDMIKFFRMQRQIFGICPQIFCNLQT